MRLGGQKTGLAPRLPNTVPGRIDRGVGTRPPIASLNDLLTFLASRPARLRCNTSRAALCLRGPKSRFLARQSGILSDTTRRPMVIAFRQSCGGLVLGVIAEAIFDAAKDLWFPRHYYLPASQDVASPLYRGRLATDWYQAGQFHPAFSFCFSAP